MRYLFSFLLLFCCSFLTLAAQDIKNPNEDEKILGSSDIVYQIISYDTDGKVYRQTYDYTTDIRIRTVLNESLLNGNWSPISKTEFLLDSKNYIYNQTDSVWYDGQWHIRQTYTSKYNSNWQLLEYLEELFYSDTLYVARRKTHILDSADNIIVSLNEFKKAGVWSNVYRRTYKYDANKNVLDSLEQNWDSEKWVNNYEYIYSYDERGNKLSSRLIRWFNNEWVQFEQEIMTYSPSNKLLTYFHEQRDFENLLYYSRNTYAYDDKGNLLTNLYEIFENDKWKNYDLCSYTYNSNNKTLTTLYRIWKNDKWLDSTRYSYVYNSNNNELTELTEIFVGDHWVNSYIYLSSYDLKGNVLTVDGQNWENEEWILDYRATFSYNYNGVRLLDERTQWYNQVLMNISKITYNDSGKELSELYEYWEDGKLSNSERQFFNYDEKNNFILGTFEKFDSGKWVQLNGHFPFVDSRNKYFAGDGYKVEVIYKTISSVKEEALPSDLFLTCSPNPSAGQLNMNYTLLEPASTSIIISNILGLEVANISNNQIQLPGSYNTQYDASHLAPGIYFVTLKSGNKSETSKIIIND